MKKAYSKPEIVFESFSLSTSIAGGCEKKTNSPAAMQCAYNYGGYMIFTDAVGACQENVVVEDGKTGDGFCYHIPSDSNNLFNS